MAGSITLVTTLFRISTLTKFKPVYEYEYERCVLVYSLRRTSLNKKTVPYVQRLHSEAPYWPSPVTGKAGFSCYRKPTMYGFVSSGYILDKDPLWVVHVSMLRSPDRSRPTGKSASLYWASEYAQLSCVSTWSSRATQYFPIMCSGPVSLPSARPCLTIVHKDGLGPSQALRTNVSPLHLWSCRVVTSMKYEATISSSRWVVQDPYPAVPGSRSGVSCSYR